MKSLKSLKKDEIVGVMIIVASALIGFGCCIGVVFSTQHNYIEGKASSKPVALHNVSIQVISNHVSVQGITNDNKYVTTELDDANHDAPIIPKVTIKNGITYSTVYKAKNSDIYYGTNK